MSLRLILALSALLLSACTAAPPLPDRYYRLAPSPAAASATAPRAPVILLEPFDAFGIYGERNLIYRRPEAGGALEQYRHQFWAEPPTLMLSDGLRSALRAALGETRVHGRETRAKPDYIIRPRLRHLYQALGSQDASAELAIEFSVVDQSNEPRFVLVFEESEPASGVAPDAFVKAAGELAASANARFLERLAEEFAR